MKGKILDSYILFFSFVSMIAIDVSTVEELHEALANAKAGQTIFITPGVYDYSTYENKTTFSLKADGTKSSPITLKAKDPINPPILRGPTIRDSSVLHITGDYWIIENIKIGISSQSISMNAANNNIIKNVEIFSVGSQGIFVRDDSSNNLFQNCFIHNTGNSNEQYGYGIVIGPNSDNNVIDQCIFKDISSEHILFGKYTNGNEVISNVFFGDGINGKNGANTFLRIGGNDTYVHDNIAYRNLNQNIEAAFKVKKVEEDSGYGSKFINNVLFMDRPYGEKDKKKKMYVVDGADNQFYVKNNRIDYGEGLINANNKEYYNSEYVTFIE